MSDMERVRRLTQRARLIGDGSSGALRWISPIVQEAARQAGAEVMTSDEFCTPREVAEPLLDFWGVADLDPCSNERSIIRAKHRYTEGGLVKPWMEKTWQNHPYSTNEPWIDKSIIEMKAGRVSELVILCMTAASTIWWKRAMVEPRRNPRVITTKRLKFIGPYGKPMDSSRFEPAMIYYGAKTARFDRCFRHIAMWSTWGR